MSYDMMGDFVGMECTPRLGSRIGHDTYLKLHVLAFRYIVEYPGGSCVQTGACNQ